MAGWCNIWALLREREEAEGEGRREGGGEEPKKHFAEGLSGYACISWFHLPFQHLAVFFFFFNYIFFFRLAYMLLFCFVLEFHYVAQEALNPQSCLILSNTSITSMSHHAHVPTQSYFLDEQKGYHPTVPPHPGSGAQDSIQNSP